jgi:hypothetical protein
MMETLLNQISRDPLNAELHLKYALEAISHRNLYLGYAELKTATYLGIEVPQVEKLIHEIRTAFSRQTEMNHNQYFRFYSLAREIQTRSSDPSVSVLDVGGGNGELAMFLPPEMGYCLAEPRVNGISGTHLPFSAGSFDYVVACHVLEHVPVPERTLFLDQLVSRARKGVILLNPFEIEGTYTSERLKLVIEITNADWAKEHLVATLPRLEDVKQYAQEKKLNIDVKPNGTGALTLAFVFLDYFASHTQFQEEWRKVNRFFNEKYVSILDSEQFPNAYLIYLGK